MRFQSALLLAAILTLSAPLSACGGGNKSAIDSATSSLPSGATVVNGISVPADPGPANDETLAGIDTTGTGIRDDVYRAIAVRYGSNPVIWRTAIQSAQAAQLSVLADGDQTLSNVANDAEMAAGSCHADITFDENLFANPDWMRMGDIIFALTADTPERFSSYKMTETIDTPDMGGSDKDRGDCK